jgi:hypothetical protein
LGWTDGQNLRIDRRRITGLPSDGNEERLYLCVAAQEDAHEARDIFASEKWFIGRVRSA